MSNPITSLVKNPYAICRSGIAISLLLTLIFNPPSILFHPTFGNLSPPDCTSLAGQFSLFCLLEGSYFLSYGIAMLILIWVISGWFPRFSGIFHWWVAYSLFHSATLIEGGEQVATSVLFFLFPLSFLDYRRNHWYTSQPIQIKGTFATWVYTIFYFLFRLQMAFIYLHAGVAKAGVPDWQNGTATYYFGNSPIFGMSDLLAPVLSPFFDNPLSLTLITYGTLVLELCLFAGLFMKESYKQNLFIIAAFFHVMIGVVHGLISFSIIMVSCLFLFLLPNEFLLEQVASESPQPVK